jgi:threonine/homoserine/homoserine lactone efflux protein
MSEFLIPFTLFAIAGSFTPGPNNIMLTASGANFGFRRTLPHILGICIGFPVMVLAVGLGLGRVFEEVPALHLVLKMAGGANSADLGQAGAGPLSFFEAAAFQWVNPKAWIMATGAISTFTLAGEEFEPQVLAMALIFTIISIPSATVWTLLGIGIARILRSRVALRTFNFSMGAMLALSVLWILLA